MSKQKKRSENRRGSVDQARRSLTGPPPRYIGIFVLGGFFLSGAAALLYEVLWVRLISLFSGHTTLATSAVLAAFMAGLAFGAFTGGRVADRSDSGGLLKLYALLELLIGITGLLSKPAITIVGAYAAEFGASALPPAIQSLLYFFLAFALLLIPTTLMGATLPILIRWGSLHMGDAIRSPVMSHGFTGHDRPGQAHHTDLESGSITETGRPQAADRWLPLFYGLNTLGAVLGTVIAGFVLLPGLGLTGSLLTAATINVLVAAVAFSLRSRPQATHAPSQPVDQDLPVLWRPALVLAFTGAAAMICQVAWTRTFALLLGSTVYAFTVMLATFLFGLAAGSLVFHRLFKLRQPGYSGLALIIAGVAAAVYIGLPIFDHLPYVFFRLQAFSALKTQWIYLVQFGLCFLVMIIPTLLMGAVFPWSVAVASPDHSSIGRQTGAYYAANTAGAIVGSAAAGLILLPLLDANGSLMVAVWIYGAAAMAAVGGSSGAWMGCPRLRYVLPVGAALLVATWFQPAWSHRLLASGMFLYASHYKDVKDYGSFVNEMDRDRVLYHRSGRNATITVLEHSTGSRYMRINGKTDASEGKDMGTQLLLGYLPLLVHPAQPRRALVIGLGSGVTAAALASDPLIRELDVIEIEPEVAQAARFFSRANRGVMDDPRLKLYFADARQFVAADRDPYDLIISEPSNPWIAGIASLYTKEAFASVKGKLAEDGVFCQWFHSYYMSEEDFKMIVKTFTSVFPHTMLMYYNQGDFFLMGSKAPWRINYRQMESAFENNGTMRRDLFLIEPVIDHPIRLLAWTFALNDGELRKYTDGAPVHTDDYPTLEFTAPKHFHTKKSLAILEGLRRFKSGYVPDGVQGMPGSNREKSLLMDLAGQSLLSTGKVDGAEGAFQKALQLDPINPRAWSHLGIIHEKRGHPDLALKAHEKALALDPSYLEGQRQIGRLYLRSGRMDQGVQHLLEVLKRIPHEPASSLELAKAYRSQGQTEKAEKLIRETLATPIPDEALRHELTLLLQGNGPVPVSADETHPETQPRP